MGNGAKAAHRRKRQDNIKNIKKPGKEVKEPTNIVCSVCKQTFMEATTREPALQEHADSRHSKTIEDCFPDFKKK